MANNTIVYKEDWAVALQARLSEPTKWKDVCNVEYTDSKVLHNPYLTDPTVQTGLRGTPYAFQAAVETDEYITIDTFYILPQVMDRADIAQSGYLKQMEMADRQAVLLNESIESMFLGDFANLTTFDASTTMGGSGSIVVSASNIDDIVRGLQQQILTNSGGALLDRNGAFIIWRPADFNLLAAFAQANGFTTADQGLKNGIGAGFSGFDYMGFTHYTSNKLTAGHLVAGVKKLYHIGICKSTYGQIMVDEKDPNLISGVSVVSRVDAKGKAWNKIKPVLFNVVVA